MHRFQPKPIIVVESALKRPAKKVKNACNHCKASHLSCGEERPCTRCVKKGKADTCMDTEYRPAGHRAKRNKSTDSEFSNELSPASSPRGSFGSSPCGSSDGGDDFPSPTIKAHHQKEDSYHTFDDDFQVLLNSLVPPPNVPCVKVEPASPVLSRPHGGEQPLVLANTAIRFRKQVEEKTGRALTASEWENTFPSQGGVAGQHTDRLLGISQSFGAVALPTLTSSTYGKVLGVNKAFEDLTGVSSESWLNGDMMSIDSLMDISVGDFLEKHLNIISRQAEEESLRVEVDVPNVNEGKGSTRCVLTVSYIPNAEPDNTYCGFVMNFTPLECY